MGETTIGTIQQLLESVLVDVDDSEATFKLRTAIQLLGALEEKHEQTKGVLRRADIDAETRENLRELGYIP